MNEYSEFGIGIPLRQGMLIQGFERRFIVYRRLSLKIRENQKPRENESDSATAAEINRKHPASPGRKKKREVKSQQLSAHSKLPRCGTS
jgi:hypothetical protein